MRIWDSDSRILSLVFIAIYKKDLIGPVFVLLPYSDYSVISIKIYNYDTFQ